MTIAPNGVTLANYDPTGIGALVFAGVSRDDYTTDIGFGDIVDANLVKLRPATVFDNSASAGDNVYPTGTVLPGNWRCLGICRIASADHQESATLFMRVS